MWQANKKVMPDLIGIHLHNVTRWKWIPAYAGM